MYQGKNRSTKHSKGNKTIPVKVATTRTENGHKQTTKTSTYNINQRDEGTQEDRGRDGGTNFILKIKKEETRLNLHEHDDDDGDNEFSLEWKLLNIQCDKILTHQLDTVNFVRVAFKCI